MTLRRLAQIVHNVIAHPLLELWPRVGNWLHEKTEQVAWPEMDGIVFGKRGEVDEDDELDGGYAVRTGRTTEIETEVPGTSTRVDVEETWPPFEPSRVVVRPVR